MRHHALVITVVLLGCSRRASLEQAAQALFEDRASDAASCVRRADGLAAAGLTADDLMPYADAELQALASSGGNPTADDQRRLQITPRATLVAREPTFLWESTSRERRVTIKIVGDQGDVATFDVADQAPYTPPHFALERGKSYRWTLVDADGNSIADWADFAIATDDVVGLQLKLLGLLALEVKTSDQRALLAVQFYRRRGLLADVLNNLQYLTKAHPKNPRLRLEMAACLAQLGNAWGAQQFLAGKQ
ncbi:MAG: hypothetical protein U1E76_06390 [Planctomycetota bacterium]